MEPSNDHRKRDAGVAMFVTVLILVIMGWLGLSALDTATRDQQVAGYQNRSRSAFFAAQAGAATALSIVASKADDRGTLPPLPTAFLGDAAMYARWQQQPSYYADPAFPNPIRWIRDGGPATGMNLANPAFVNTLWQVNVVGQSYDAAGGVGSHRASTDRLEVTAIKVLGSTGGSAGY
jgi:hypothetical protein